jgi:hypothetical protein
MLTNYTIFICSSSTTIVSNNKYIASINLPVIRRSIVLSTEESLKNKEQTKATSHKFSYCSLLQVSSSLVRQLTVKPNLFKVCQLFCTSLVCSASFSLPSDRTTELLISDSETFAHQNICFIFICDRRNYVWIDEKLIVFSAIYWMEVQLICLSEGVYHFT